MSETRPFDPKTSRKPLKDRSVELGRILDEAAIVASQDPDAKTLTEIRMEERRLKKATETLSKS